MSYTLNEIRLAAYNWTKLPNMTQRERALWEGLGYAYEQYRCGFEKEICDDIAQTYIKLFFLGGGVNDRADCGRH